MTWSWRDAYPGHRAIVIVLPEADARDLLSAHGEIAPGVILLGAPPLAGEPRLSDPPAERAAGPGAMAAARGANKAEPSVEHKPTNRLRRRPRPPASQAERDRALVEEAIAEGRITKCAPGSALVPSWLREEGF